MLTTVPRAGNLTPSAVAEGNQGAMVARTLGETTMRIAGLILMLTLASCQTIRLGSNTAKVASDAANEQAQEQYGCQPFTATDFDVSSWDGSHWCNGIARYWQGDLTATVVLDDDMQLQRIAVSKLWNVLPAENVEAMRPEDATRARMLMRDLGAE
jgi:hypothetical protein